MTADLASLRHRLVRDIAWLLHAPDLLITSFAGRPTLSELGLSDDETRRAWLTELERAPQALESAASPRLKGRLGLYHEILWQFLLANAPNTRLLAHNLPVRDGKRTLGEIDLLYATHDDPRPVHLELAIKYYLGLPQGPGHTDSQARWIGPGCADSLAIKRQRTVINQLPLSHRPEAANVLARHIEQPPLQRLAMPGILFQPWPDRLPAPYETGPEACFGTWLPISRWSDFCHTSQAARWRGVFLDKPHWLAPPPEDALWDLATLTHALEAHFNQRATPRQLAVKREDGSWQRLFVVGSTWPHTIPLLVANCCTGDAETTNGSG